MKALLVLCLLLVCRYMVFAQPVGQVIGWGNNGSGQATGVPTGIRPYVITNVVTVDGKVLTDATTIVAGGYYSLSLKSDGTVAGWGNNDFGQATGVSSSTGNGLVTIDGQVLSNVSAITAGGSYSIAVKRDGTVLAWGVDNYHHKIEVPSSLSNAVVVDAGVNHCLVLKKDGTLVSLGTTKQPPSGLSNIVAIAAGKGSAFGGLGNDLALKSDGSVVSWRLRGILEDPLPKELTNITAIASGGGHYLALKKDGTVFGWGINDKGQATGVPSTNYLVGGFVSIDGHILDKVAAIAAGGDASLALKKDGTVVAWGQFGFREPATVPAGLTNVVAIATSGSTCLAITTNSTVADKFRH